MFIGIGLFYEKYLLMKLLKRIGIGILFFEIFKINFGFRYLLFYVLILINFVLFNFGEMLCIKIC